MNDWDCMVIQTKVMGHLIRCAFDDWSLSCLELGKELSQFKTNLEMKKDD